MIGEKGVAAAAARRSNWNGWRPLASRRRILWWRSRRCDPPRDPIPRLCFRAVDPPGFSFRRWGCHRAISGLPDRPGRRNTRESRRR